MHSYIDKRADGGRVMVEKRADGSVICEVALPPERLRVVITGIASSDPQNTQVDLANGVVACKRGTTLTPTAELQTPDGQVVALSPSFRMPIVKYPEGKDVAAVAIISFDEGVATTPVPFETSGIFAITPEAINSRLAPEEQLDINLLTIIVAM